MNRRHFLASSVAADATAMQARARTMSCVLDPEANRMFTRDYREPYVVPINV